MLGTVSRSSKISLILALSFAALSTFGADPFALSFFALAAVLPPTALYLVVRWAVRDGLLDIAGGRRRTHGGTAAEILDRRYARGEIDREGYQRMRRDIETG